MAETVAKGITITFRGNTVEFDNSVESMNRALRLLQNETAKLNRDLKLDPTNVDLLNQKLDVLRQRESLVNDEIKRYRASLVEAVDPSSAVTNTEKWKKLETEVKQASSYMKDLSTMINETQDVDRLKDLKEEYGRIYDKWMDMRLELVEMAEANDAVFDGKMLTDYQTRINNLDKELANIQTQAINVENAIKRIAGQDAVYNLEQYSTKMEELSGTFDKVANATKKISAVATVGLAGMVSSASSFESAMAGVSKTLSDDELAKAGLTLDDIAQGIRNMAKEIPATTTELASIAEMAGQLGVPAENILEFTRVVADLGVATNVAGDEGAKAMAQLFNIMGTDLTLVDNFASALVELGNNSATTEADILNMATRLGSVGATIGLTEQEVLGLATAMSSVGLTAEAGGSAMSKILNDINTKVGTNSKKLKGWAEITGLSVKEFKRQWEEYPISVVEKIFTALGDAGEKGENLSAILDDLGITNIRTADTMRRLSLSNEGLSDYLAMANEAWEENSALTTEAEKRYKTFQSRLTILKNTLQDLYVSLGNELLPIITPVVEKIRSFIDELSNAPDGVKKFVVGLTGFTAILSPVSKALSKLTGGFGNYAKTLADIIKKQGGNTENLTLMQKAFSNFVNSGAVNSISTQFSNLGGLFGKVTDIAKTVARTIFTLEGEDSLGGAFTKLIGVIKGGPAVWLPKLSSMFSSLWGFIASNPIALIIVAIGILVAGLITAYHNSEEFRLKLNALFNTIKNDVKPIIDKLIEAIKSLWSWLKEKMQPVIEALISIGIGYIDLITNLWTLLTGFFKSISPALEVIWNQILKPFASWLGGAFFDTLSGIFKLVSWGIDLFSKLIGKANEYLGFVGGSGEKVSNTTTGIRNLREISRVASGGLGINTAGLGAVYQGGVLQLTTNINVNNNGQPINESEIRRWGNVITQVVSDNLGRNMA